MTALELDRYTAAEVTTIADALKKLAVVAQQNPAPQSSVTLSQTAKGATQVEVKVYAVDPVAAAGQAVQIYDRLVAKYAAGDGNAPLRN